VNATHQERRAFFLPIIATTVYLLACIPLVSAFKGTGLAVAGIILAVVNFVLFGTIIRTAVTPRSIERGIFWKVLLASAVMAGVTFPLRGLSIFLSIPAAAVTYGAMVIALKIVPRDDLAAIRKLVRKRIRKSRPAPATEATPSVPGAEG
jgi:peptidoglycan biosynthesis protein MviN/MurJ (putative lipid II flippase)